MQMDFGPGRTGVHASDSESTPLSRICRSLVSWYEIPARVMLPRADQIRFAHAMGTTARQLLMAERSLEAAGRPSPGIATPERLMELFRLHRPEEAARAAETAVEDMVSVFREAGVPESETILGRWLDGAADGDLVEESVDAVARAVYERARHAGALAVALADSWARGFADSASDVDVRLIMPTVPRPDDRLRIVADLAAGGGIRQYGDEAYITADQFVTAGRKIDVKYHEVERVRSAVTRPFELGGAIDLLELIEVNRVVDDPVGILLDLTVAFQTYRGQRASEIARVSLTAAGRIAEDTLASGPSPATSALMLGPGLEYAARAWAGINGMIHAFPKWLDRIATDFAYGPPGGIDRLTALCSRDWSGQDMVGAAQEWRAFVSDLDSLQRHTGMGAY